MEMMERLRTARPRLIFRVDRVEDPQSAIVLTMAAELSIGKPALVVLDEGYDPHSSTLNRPVYWRIVERADGKFYLSTFLLEREFVAKVCGSDGVALCCDPLTGMAFARIEMSLEKTP